MQGGGYQFLKDVQTFITSFASDSSRLLRKAGAVSYTGFVNTGRALSAERKFLVRSQGRPGIHVVLIRKGLPEWL